MTDTRRERAEAIVRGWLYAHPRYAHLDYDSLRDAIARALPANHAALVGRLREAAAQTVFENHPETTPGAVSRLLTEAADRLEGRPTMPQDRPDS